MINDGGGGEISNMETNSCSTYNNKEISSCDPTLPSVPKTSLQTDIAVPAQIDNEILVPIDNKTHVLVGNEIHIPSTKTPSLLDKGTPSLNGSESIIGNETSLINNHLPPAINETISLPNTLLPLSGTLTLSTNNTECTDSDNAEHEPLLSNSISDESIENALPTFHSLPSSFQYSPSLNCLISISEQSGIEILDIHSRQITTHADIPKLEGRSTLPPGLCKFLNDEEKLVVSSGNRIGCRSTNGEQIFLNTILQVAEVPSNGLVTVELDIVKAGLLLNGLEQCLRTTDPSSTAPNTNSISNKSKCQQVALSLKSAYEKAVSKMKDVSGQSIKWLNVCFTMEHSILMSVFNTALLLCKQDKRGPALPVIGDILQRLTAMQKSTFESICSEKRLMFNEVDRLQTFNSWPHMNYKWALPGPMAEAGFYHPHSSTKSAEDRAMCFTCSVCLVCWESSDQPWSEHKRHAHICPFVKGEHTENVPLQIYTATAGAQKLSRDNDNIVCMGNNSCDNLLAVGTDEGYIVIWEIFPVLKVHSEYQISVSAMKDSYLKQRSSKTQSKDPTTEEKDAKLPEPLKNIAAKKASVTPETTNGLESTLTAKECDELTTDSPPLKPPVDTETMTDVVFDGESYCVIVDPVDESVSEQTSTTPSSTPCTNASPVFKEGNNKVDVNLAQPDIPDVDKKLPPPPPKSSSKTKVKNVERSCRITSVTLMKDEKTCEKFIIAGVKIESRKVRKSKEVLKYKLALLIYKLAGKVKVKSDPTDPHLGGIWQSGSPYLNNPFAPMGAHAYEDDFSVGSDDDYSMYDEVNMDHNQLAVIDEYLLASQKNSIHHSANGGTQNIALSGNEIKTGFDQEEIVKIEDVKTVYEDCTFHKFDIDRSFYTKDMYISDLIVVDGFLVTVLKQEPDKKVLETDKFQIRDFLLVSLVTSNKKQVINFQLVAQRQFESDSLIQDLTTVPCRNLPSNLLSNFTALHQYKNTESNSPYANLMPKTLVLLGLSDNSLMFLSVPQLIKLKLASNLPESRSIHKITYCNTLSSVAICDNQGYLEVCPCLTNQDQPFEMTVDEISASVSQWNTRLTCDELNLLSSLTKFEPVTQGCYIFFPVNWYVTRTGGNKSSQASPVPNHMLRLSPVEMDKRLMKRTEQLDIELSKTDFTFRMFVLVQTSVGYFDILVNLKTPLKDNNDFTCSFYIDESRKVNCQGSDIMDSGNNERLICGPILFSSVVMSNKLSGQFTIIVPELINKKSLYVIVKLESCQPLMVEELGSVDNPKTNSGLQNDFLMTNILKDVYVGVYQFKRLASNAFYFPGCRNTVISDETFQENLIDQYLELVATNSDIRDGFEIRIILDLLVWITSVHLYSTLKDNLPLVSILSQKLPSFLKASFLYGDRSICHACCQILLGLKRCTTDIIFSKLLEEELWNLLPHIHHASSSAAYHWAFLLLCDVMGSHQSVQRSLMKLTSMLMDVGDAYGNSFSETQMILDARYGLSDMVFEPFMIEPLCLTMKCGSTFSPSTTKVFDMIRVASDHLPGILEAQPLHFSCLSASEGSKVEVLGPKLSSATAKNHGCPTGGGTIPLAGPMPIVGVVPSGSLIHEYTSSPPVEVVGETFVPESMEEKAIKLLIDSANQPEFTVHHTPPTGNSKKDTSAESATASSQLEEFAIPDESVIPKQMCMIIDKMHVYSVHYVILDFKSPVFLSDLIFPPLKALASITISVWGPGQNPEEAQVITHSDRICKKALIFSNMVTPVHFQYMKIVFVGTESCSAIIPLGQFFGYTTKELCSPHQTADYYDKEYESISCRYALTADRIKSFPIRLDASSKYTTRLNDVMLSTLKRDYLQCAHLQLSLNFLRNNPAWTCVNNLLVKKDIDQDFNNLPSLPEKSFSSKRLLLTCLLDTIVFHVSSLGKSNGNSSLNSTNLIAKDEFLSLFKRLCIYGAACITELSTSVLFMLCGKSLWWSEALVDIFQHCFCDDTIIPLPRRRLFNVIMKLIHSTEDINQVVENFLVLLQQHVTNMLCTDNKTANISMLNTMFDYILLLLTQILESKDNNTWNFFTPWEYLPEVANNGSAQTAANFTFGNNQPSGLNKWFQQVSGSTVAEKMNNLQKAMLVDGGGPKKVSGMKVWYPPKLDIKTTSSTQTSPSPTSSVRVSNDPLNSCKIETDIVSNIMDSTGGIDVAQKVFISKQIVDATLKCLMNFVISKLDNGNPEQLILALKVCSLIVFNSKDLTSLNEILSEMQIRKLYFVCMASDSNQWLVHTINLLLKSFVNQKTLSTGGTPTESDMLGDSVGEISTSKSKITDLSKCPAGLKKSEQDVVTSKAEQFNKMYYESMKNKFYEVTEGHHSKTNPPPGKSSEGVTIKKELEAMLSANDCKVLHPVRKDFNRILESTLLSLQRNIHKRRPVLRSTNERKQMLHISDVEKYFSDLNNMQSSTLQFLLTILMDMIRENTTQCDLLPMQELVYLLNMAKGCDAKLNATTYVNLSQTIVVLFQSTTCLNDSYFSLKKQMMDFILRTNAESALQAQFNLLLLQSSEVPSPSNKQSNSVMLFKDLMIRENLQDTERVLVKKLLVKQICCSRNSVENTDLLDILKGIDKSGLFLLFSNNEEVNVTNQIADAIASKVKKFIDENVVLLQSCQHERSDSKRTVFSLYNGSMRLTGKCHTVENDVAECVQLLDLLKRIIGSNALKDIPQDKKLRMITKMIQSLCKCCKLVTESKFAKSASLLMSGFNVRVCPTSSVHPLAAAINSVLMEVYVNDFWELLVYALVDVLKKEQLTDVCGSTADGFKVFILTLLKSSERVWSLWVERGGFDVICQSIISDCSENMCWTDSLNHSTVIQDLYSSSIAAASQKLLDRDRVVKDHTGTVLENFAPYAKIYGPATSTGADVLLVNKSPLRRSRFAAWAHQFQHTDDPWIELTIVLPFEVKLYEVIIYMHGNYLIGAPAQAILELKGLSDSFVTMSPTLQTGGLGSIVFHLAEGQICKELRFRLRRPFDGDHIKLNLIEVFGSTIFEVMENESSIPVRRKLNIERWIDILLQLLEDIPSALDAFCCYQDFPKLLSALIGNIPYVCSLCLHRLSSLFILRLLPTSTDFTYKVTENITSRMLHNSYLNHFNTSQLQLVIQLLSDLIMKSNEEEQIRILRYLLDWICEFLISVKEEKCSIVNDVIRLMVSKIFSLLKDKDKTQFSINEKLRTVVQDFLLDDKTPDNLLIQFSKLLHLLVSVDPSVFSSYHTEANRILQEKETFCSEEKTMGSLVAVIACYDSGTDQIKAQCDNFMDKLSSLLCSTLRKVDKSNSFNGNESLRLLCWVVSIFSYFFTCESKISSWFAQDAGQKFWEPLIRFVCKYDSIKTRCLQIFTLQSTVISIFREILYMNPQNQEYFCSILIKLLQNGQVTNLNGYMKLLLLQLVIAEDTVVVHFRSKSDSYVLQNTHGIHVRITTSLSEIEQTLLAIRCELIGSNSKSKSDKVENTNPNPADNIPGADSDLADYVLQSGSSAAAKRKTKTKQDSSALQKSKDQTSMNLSIEFFLPEFGDGPLPKKLKFGQILQLLHDKDPNLLNTPPLLLYSLINKGSKKQSEDTSLDHFVETPLLCTMLGTFARQGGLPLLTNQVGSEDSSDGECSYIYLFSLILPLPGFARVFLEDRIKSELLLRLMLGVGETKSGQLIRSLAIAQDLPVLPLKSLLHLLQETTADSDKGLELRKLAFERRVVDFILNNLRMLAHHEDSKESKVSVGIQTSAASSSNDGNYWAKGTGFGTGSTVSSWDIEKAMKAKKKEEEQIVVVFQVLAAFVEVKDLTMTASVQLPLLDQFHELMDLVQILFANSCIIEVLAGYLRNDSVLDMSRHIPLYHAILALLRALASGKAMLPLLVSMKGHSTDLTGKSNTLVKLLTKLRGCVETYQSRLKLSCKTKASKSEARPVGYHLKNRLKLNKQDEDKDSKSNEMSESDIIELNLLLTDIHSTSDYVLLKVEQYEQELNATSVFKTTLPEEVDVKEKGGVVACSYEESEEERYFNDMIGLQFDTYEIVTEKDDNSLQFNVPYHYANSVRSAAKTADATNAARSRRLAQEVASLSTSLPISYSSTVFLQCDEDRLDVMKVLITGPEDTPYENGCFEFDIYFPPDYPTSPMLVNLQTTGKHTVRFNPNLYNDGKVCLSILNTWHGRPEERWNAQTSNLLQVLVSIQSLILVSDPYFNEPGYERLRGTAQGKQNSNDYNANIQQASVKWAMLEQIKRPSACFKKAIRKHFLLKKNKIISQCEKWLVHLKDQAGKRKSALHSYEALKTHFAELRLELDKLEQQEKKRSENEEQGEEGNSSAENSEVFVDEPSVAGLNTPPPPSKNDNFEIEEIESILAQDEDDTYSMSNVVYL